MTTSDETYLKMLAQLSTEELMSFAELIATALRQKKESQNRLPNRVQFNPFEHFERECGGWTMRITGVDPKITSWSSFVGTFTKGCREWYQIGKLYLDLGMGQQQETYTFFEVNQQGEPVIIRKVKSDVFAPELLEIVEKYL